MIRRPKYVAVAELYTVIIIVAADIIHIITHPPKYAATTKCLAKAQTRNAVEHKTTIQ